MIPSSLRVVLLCCLAMLSPVAKKVYDSHPISLSSATADKQGFDVIS